MSAKRGHWALCRSRVVAFGKILGLRVSVAVSPHAGATKTPAQAPPRASKTTVSPGSGDCATRCMRKRLKKSGVDLPLCCSCACLHTAFIAISVHSVFQGQFCVFPLVCSLSSVNQVRAVPWYVIQFWALSPGYAGLCSACGVVCMLCSMVAHAVLGAYLQEASPIRPYT